MKPALPAILLAVSLSIGAVALARHRPVQSEWEITNRPVQMSEDGYISSNTCKACHPAQYETWHASYHRTMTQIADSSAVVATFNGEVKEVYGRPMRLWRQNGEFWSEFDDPDWDRSTGVPARITRRVVLVTGSHHQQIYWYPTGNSRVLGHLPAIYLIAEKRWIPRRTAVMHPPEYLFSETGSWNAVCVACHTTNGKPRFDTPFRSQPIQAQNVDTSTAEFGISCEGCHGPSEEHVKRNRNPQRRYWFHLTGQPDSTVTQPTRLDATRSSQVCGQCHSVWEFYDERGEREANFRGLPYRPGDDLLKTRFMAQPTTNAESSTLRGILNEDPNFVRDSFWADGMVRVTGREYNALIESPCYKNATDDAHRLSCFSCHTLHKPAGDPRRLEDWTDDQLKFDKDGKDGNEACLQCHTTFRANLTSHTKHAAGSTGSSCYSCHMPFTTYGLLKTIRSHQISSPSVAVSLQTGRPNACNLCHLDRTSEWTAEHLENWYGIVKPELTEDDRSIATSILWLLSGDAGQRAIAAQSMGSTAPQQASGTAWMAPYLTQLLGDPYDAVRFVAYRSLGTLPGFSTFEFPLLGTSEQRAQSQRRALDVWARSIAQTGFRDDPALLLDRTRTFKTDVVSRLVRARDNRRVFLRE